MADAYRAYVVAVQNADASVQRRLGEASTRELEPLIAILTYVRRFTESLQALPPAPASRMRLWALTTYASDTLMQIADALERSRPVAPLRDDTSARRVADAGRLLDPLVAMHDAADRVAEFGIRN